MERDTNPTNFSSGRGLFHHAPGYDSFPSGHATEAFAAASAMTAEVTPRWPRGEWIVGPILYGGAALVGVSRVYHDMAWASDVVLGAGVGTVTGLTSVRWQHAHPGNRLDRWLLPQLRAGAHGDVLVLWGTPATRVPCRHVAAHCSESRRGDAEHGRAQRLHEAHFRDGNQRRGDQHDGEEENEHGAASVEAMTGRYHASREDRVKAPRRCVKRS